MSAEYSNIDVEYLEKFYRGSRILEPYCKTVGLQIDQVGCLLLIFLF